MQLIYFLSVIAGLVGTSLSLSAQQRSEHYWDRPKTTPHKDMTGRFTDPPEKYFHESLFHPHYDGRFATQELSYNERKLALKNLVQTYLATFADLGVETWLMHGSLLGWWWNKKVLTDLLRHRWTPQLTIPRRSCHGTLILTSRFLRQASTILLRITTCLSSTIRRRASRRAATTC